MNGRLRSLRGRWWACLLVGLAGWSAGCAGWGQRRALTVVDRRQPAAEIRIPWQPPRAGLEREVERCVSYGAKGSCWLTRERVLAVDGGRERELCVRLESTTDDRAKDEVGEVYRLRPLDDYRAEVRAADGAKPVKSELGRLFRFLGHGDWPLRWFEGARLDSSRFRELRDYEGQQVAVFSFGESTDEILPDAWKTERSLHREGEVLVRLEDGRILRVYERSSWFIQSEHTSQGSRSVSLRITFPAAGGPGSLEAACSGGPAASR